MSKMTTKEKIHETIVRIPAFSLNQKRVGKNIVHHIIETPQRIKVTLHKYKSKSYLSRTEKGQEKLIFMPRSPFTKDGDKRHALRIKSKLKDIKELNEWTELQWLFHPLMNSKLKPKSIVDSWKGAFSFVEENIADGVLGLREPQIGALHAIAAHWSVSQAPATVVMPTGTGKTETMLSTMIYHKCDKILLLVPSDALRNQLFWKFATLGELQRIGVVNKNALRPRVGLITRAIKTSKQAEELVEHSNVLITTPSVLNFCSDEICTKIADLCDFLFVDEAHHLGAPTWKRIHDLFKSKSILQFTATPFRNDRKRIDGEIIYNYPLSRARVKGYFQKIKLIGLEEYDEQKYDTTIARRAVSALDLDLKNNFDHLLMARAKSIASAKEIFDIYKRIAIKHAPILIHSKTPDKEKNLLIDKIANRKTRIIVCVDMLGEGFDLPNLKIAALHDVHKSLAVTLQFIGRFTRMSKKVGEAKVVVNIADIDVKDCVENLYSQDADWNALLEQKSESTISKEISLQEVIKSFQGDLDKHISLWNLRPSFSTVVYQTKCQKWLPRKFVERIPQNFKKWTAISAKENLLACVLANQQDVKWGRYKDIKNSVFNLFIMFWSQKHNLLFVHGSDYEAINMSEIVKNVAGDGARVIAGPLVFRVYANVERAMVANLGAAKTGTIRYTMYFGPDVVAGLSDIEKAQSELSNLFGWGYENGNKISFGCSKKKGKIWSRGGSPIIDWKDWCLKLAAKLRSDKINEIELIKGFLRPEEIFSRVSSVPLSIEWGEAVTRDDEERISIYFGKKEFKLYEVSISIIEFKDAGPIKFQIASDTHKTTYELLFHSKEEGKSGYEYVKKSGPDVFVQIGGREKIPFFNHMEKDPVIVTYVDGSFSYNNFYIKAECKALYDKNRFETRKWKNVNITVESQGKQRKRNSIQYFLAEEMKKDFEILINDDGSGEAADLICLRKESEDTILMRLVHCKYAIGGVVGGSIDNLYDVCGQAQKSIKWKHSGFGYLEEHIRKRESKWREDKASRFIKGSIGDLIKLRKMSKFYKLAIEVFIAQPGLSKSKATDDILRLIGATELYLKKTTDAPLKVICSA